MNKNLSIDEHIRKGPDGKGRNQMILYFDWFVMTKQRLLFRRNVYLAWKICWQVFRWTLFVSWASLLSSRFALGNLFASPENVGGQIIGYSFAHAKWKRNLPVKGGNNCFCRQQNFSQQSKVFLHLSYTYPTQSRHYFLTWTTGGDYHKTNWNAYKFSPGFSSCLTRFIPESPTKLVWLTCPTLCTKFKRTVTPHNKFIYVITSPEIWTYLNKEKLNFNLWN